MKMSSKWQMNRAGVLNFWYYDDEVFDFSDGKLLLRGSNGSGKSVTMQSFIPVLLDGKKSPDRLDPFGSRSRRMEDYLLGEKEVVNRDERTGYLYLEFKRTDIEQYITIGIGLQAKRNKPMKFWGFVVTDNRRVGQDIDLFKYEQNAGEKQKIPLSRIELENLIADGGHVVQTQTEYMELVNKYVFGFETMEAYEDLIKLLIQLRSPKLSKDFRPTVIYDILEAALPPLTDEDLRYLSDTIEQMDQTKQQIEQLKREMDAIQKLNHVYTTYNKRVLAEQADGMVAANQRLQQNQMRYDELTEEKTTIDQQIDELTQSIRELEIEQETYRQKEERLSAHDVWNIEKERLNEQERLEKESENLRKKTQQLEQRESKEHQLRNENRTLEETIGEKETEAEEMLAELEQDALDISFDEQHQINVQDYERNQQAEFNFSVWIKEARDHLSFLEKVTDELRRFEQLKEKIQERNKELADEEKKLDDVKEQERQWFELFEEDKSKKLAEIHQWVNDISLISVSEEVLQQVSRAVQSLYEPTSYEQVKDPFRQAVYQMEQRKREELSKLEFQNKQLTEEIREKESELHEWKLKKIRIQKQIKSQKKQENSSPTKGFLTSPFIRLSNFRIMLKWIRGNVWKRP